MPDRTSEYFASRAVAEETMASFAIEPSVAAAHAEMAERYAQLAIEFDINNRAATVLAAPPERAEAFAS